MPWNNAKWHQQIISLKLSKSTKRVSFTVTAPGWWWERVASSQDTTQHSKIKSVKNFSRVVHENENSSEMWKLRNWPCNLKISCQAIQSQLCQLILPPFIKGGSHHLVVVRLNPGMHTSVGHPIAVNSMQPWILKPFIQTGFRPSPCLRGHFSTRFLKSNVLYYFHASFVCSQSVQ